jgi:ABC-2 type transport system permease protein
MIRKGRIVCIVRKEFQQLRRDRRMLPIVFISPVIQLLILGYAANLDVRDIPAVVCNLDHSMESRELLEEFFASGYFQAVSYVENHDEVEVRLKDGEATIGIVIPQDFGRKLAADSGPPLQLIGDGSESSLAVIAFNYASIIVNRYSSRYSLDRLGDLPPSLKPVQPDLKIRIWYNPELKSRNYMVPGILAMLLMVMTMMLTSLAIVKEKEVGTLEQLMVTPIRPIQLVIGKLIPFILIGAVDIALVILVARLLFGIVIAGSVFLLFALSGVFLISTLGLGLLVSTVSRTQQQAMMTSVFFVMLPMIILSGFVFPIENMPRLIQYATLLFPLRYYFLIVRGVFLKGAGMPELWDETLILFGIGVLILVVSALRFRKRLE